jgi:hypothetical protein
MPVPWVQIVRLMPSILEISRELLKRARGTSRTAGPPGRLEGAPSSSTLEARISALEENERGQAELVTRMADQLAQLTEAVTALHRQSRLLILGQVVTAVVAIVALVFALR